MVVDDLGDDEAEELLGEGRVEVSLLGESPQPRDLTCLALQVRRRETVRGLEYADLLRELEGSASRWISAASMLSML